MFDNLLGINLVEQGLGLPLFESRLLDGRAYGEGDQTRGYDECDHLVLPVDYDEYFAADFL